MRIKRHFQMTQIFLIFIFLVVEIRTEHVEKQWLCDAISDCQQFKGTFWSGTNTGPGQIRKKLYFAKSSHFYIE